MYRTRRNGDNFYKLGQFLATRPDIIGEELALI